MQTSGFVDQLLDIHRDGNAFRNAARACAGFGSFCNLGGLGKPRMDLGKTGDNRLVENRFGHVRFPHSMGTVTLRSPPKSSEFRAMLWLLSPGQDNELIGHSGS
jgi:hypothetical protein